MSVGSGCQDVSKIILMRYRFLNEESSKILVQECRDIPSVSRLLLDLFPVFRSGRAGQILFLEFSKDGPAENRD